MTEVSSSEHRQAWDLIPWIVNGTASEDERQDVQAHLQNCSDCREELEFQHRLQHAVTREAAPDSDAQANWARLSQRLDGAAPADGSARLAVRRAKRTGWRWATAAMVVQGIGLGVLGSALWWRVPAGGSSSPVAAYRTLSASVAAASPATIRVVFVPTMTVVELHAVLATTRLQVVSGPSEADVWSLAPADESERLDTDRAVRLLRASPRVRFAEPIAAAP